MCEQEFSLLKVICTGLFHHILIFNYHLYTYCMCGVGTCAVQWMYEGHKILCLMILQEPQKLWQPLGTARKKSLSPKPEVWEWESLPSDYWDFFHLECFSPSVFCKVHTIHGSHFHSWDSSLTVIQTGKGWDAILYTRRVNWEYNKIFSGRVQDSGKPSRTSF